MNHDNDKRADRAQRFEAMVAHTESRAPGAATTAALAWLPTILDRIVPRFDPVRIILFGSHARGSARADSDLDLLVVLPQAPDRRRAAVEIMRVLGDLPVSKDILVSTPHHLAERGQINGLAYKTALEEGRVVYERA